MTPKLINKNKREMIYNNEDKRKKPLIERKGDWLCPKCNNLNFAFRLICNRCQSPKFDADSQQQQSQFTNQSNSFANGGFNGMPSLTPSHNINELSIQAQNVLNKNEQGLNFIQQFKQLDDIQHNEMNDVNDVNANHLLKFQSSSSNDDEDEDIGNFNDGPLGNDEINEDNEDEQIY